MPSPRAASPSPCLAEEPTTPTTPTKPESPKTADNGVVVYGLVAVMAAGAVVVMTSRKRKAI